MNNLNHSPWQRLKDLLKHERAIVYQLYIYAFFSGIVGLSLPLGIQSVIHFIQGGQITTSWIVLIILVISGVFITGWLQLLQLRLTENIQQRIFVRYSFDLAYRFPRFNRSSLKGVIPTEWMNRFFDILSLQKGIAKVLLDVTAAGLQIVFSLLVLSFYHPFYIGFSILLIVLLVFIFKPLIISGFKTSLEESKHKYKTAHWLQEIAKSNWSIRTTPNGNHYLKQLDDHAVSYLKSREAHFKVLWQQSIWMIAIKSIIVASLLGLGGYLVINQQINLGQFVAAEILILLLLGAVEKVIQNLETLYDVFTSLEKLGQLQDVPLTFEEQEDGESSTFFPIALIDIQNDHVSTIFEMEEFKHTMVLSQNQQNAHSFLQELIDPSISEFRKPRWNYSIPQQANLAKQLEEFGWYSNDIQLMDCSLILNITLGRELTMDAVKLALETVGLGELPAQLKDGYHHQLNHYFQQIAVSESERLLIARAIVHAPQLLILSFFGLSLSQMDKKELIASILRNYPNTSIICSDEVTLMEDWNQYQLER
jgi:ABC-type bacteriocin/lantibiotic exporter with double-glycine peptidase domain